MTDLGIRLAKAYSELSATPKPPRVLYHYTSGVGLLGILESRQLWATAIRYMNDSSEVTHARTFIAEVLREQQSKFDEADIRPVFELAQRFAQDTQTRFVTCFCEERDLLSQWRAYGHSGGGYCIGFRVASLLPQGPAKSQWSELKLQRVIYDEAEKRGHITRLIETVVREGRDSDGSDAGLFLAAALREYAVLFKHPSFSEEREWRLVLPNPAHPFRKEIKVRAGVQFLIPYVELAFAGLPMNASIIEEIVVGPTVDKEVGAESVTAALTSKGYDSAVAIVESQIPLRRADP